MNWVHVMEGGGWKTRLATKYGISSIPRLFVLDRNGVCIAENARGRNVEIAVRRALAVEADPSATAPTDPETARLLRQLARARFAVQRTTPPLERISRRLSSLESSLQSDRQPTSPRVAEALAKRLVRVRKILVDSRTTLYRLGVVEVEHDPALAIDPPDTAAMRGAAGRMLVECDAARQQLAWAGDELNSLQLDIVTRLKAPETLGREIGELHDHAMQLAATWCGR
jgi:hypothetical protein